MYLVLLSYMRPRLDIWVAYFALFGSKGALTEEGWQMIELKWNWAYSLYLDPPENQKESAQNVGYVKVVNKDDADKVIAELKDKLDLYKRGWEENDKIIGYLYAELLHQKYRRCLAMAKLCHWKMGVFIYKKEKNDFYYRWHKRWLKIAEEFKEAGK